MTFSGNHDKYKSGFGKDGSQIIPMRTEVTSYSGRREKQDFGASQRLNKGQLLKGAQNEIINQ